MHRLQGTFTTLRTPDQIALMRDAGRVVRAALDAAAEASTPGTTTAEVDAVAGQVIRMMDGESLFRNYPTYVDGRGFPADTCVSVNEEIVHGIPGERRLLDGDIVTVDCGVRLNGWCADAAVTVIVGEAAGPVRAMVQTAEELLAGAIALMTPGRRWSDVAGYMQDVAEGRGYGVVREFVGHGIGQQLHEPPQAPGFVSAEFLLRGDFTLRPGMVVAIEPMLTLGSSGNEVLPDGWTVVTRDGSPACHVEHTVAVTHDGPEVLTDGC